MEVIGTITFFVEDRLIKSKSDFDSNYFRGDILLSNKVAELLHYDFLHRLKEEKLIDFQIKTDS